MIRLALVGPGRWGRILVESVQGVSHRVRFTHVVARSPNKAAAWSDHHGITLTDNLRDVLQDPDIDGVVLATPHSQHVDQIVEVAQAGKDLFCEKPIALSKAGADRALGAITLSDSVFMPGHNRRFLPAVAEMKGRITRGDLGRILHLEGNMSSHVGFGEIYTDDMWRVATGESPAGGLAAAGFHLIDLMIHLNGPIDAVAAQSARLVHSIDHDDTTSFLLRFNNKATGYIGTLTATAREFRLQVFGDQGWLELRDQNQLVWSPVQGDRESQTFPSISMERLQLEAFADAIDKRVRAPVDFEEIRNGIAVFEGVAKSVETDQLVDISLSNGIQSS